MDTFYKLVWHNIVTTLYTLNHVCLQNSEVGIDLAVDPMDELELFGLDFEEEIGQTLEDVLGVLGSDKEELVCDDSQPLDPVAVVASAQLADVEPLVVSVKNKSEQWKTRKQLKREKQQMRRQAQGHSGVTHDVSPATLLRARAMRPSAHHVTLSLALGQEEFGQENFVTSGTTFCCGCLHNTVRGDLHIFCVRCHLAYGINSCRYKSAGCKYCEQMTVAEISKRRNAINDQRHYQWYHKYRVLPPWLTSNAVINECEELKLNNNRYVSWERRNFPQFSTELERGSIFQIFAALKIRHLEGKSLGCQLACSITHWVRQGYVHFHNVYRRGLWQYASAIVDRECGTSALQKGQYEELKRALTLSYYNRSVTVGELARYYGDTPPPLDVHTEMAMTPSRRQQTARVVQETSQRKVELKPVTALTLGVPPAPTERPAVVEPANRKRVISPRYHDLEEEIKRPRMHVVRPVEKSYITHDSRIHFKHTERRDLSEAFTCLGLNDTVFAEEVDHQPAFVHAFRTRPEPIRVMKITPSILSMLKLRKDELATEYGKGRAAGQPPMNVIPTTRWLPLNPAPFIAPGTGVSFHAANYPRECLPGMNAEKLDGATSVTVQDRELRYLESLGRLQLHQQSVLERFSGKLSAVAAARVNSDPQLSTLSRLACELTVETGSVVVESLSHIVLFRRRGLAGHGCTSKEYCDLLTRNDLTHPLLAGK